MGEDVAGGVLWYVVRNAPTFLAMFFLMLLSVRGRLRFSLGTTVGIALGIIAVVSLACGIGVAAFAGEEGVWATIPVLVVSLLSRTSVPRRVKAPSTTHAVIDGALLSTGKSPAPRRARGRRYRPSAFLSAETRRRDTGIFSSTAFSVSSSVPPDTDSISSTMDRFTR